MDKITEQYDVNENHEPRLDSCVIVLYFPKESMVEYILKISIFFNKIVLIDNTPKNKSFFTKKSFFPPNIFLISNFKNRGVAAALNTGCHFLFDRESNYTILFDQDSSIKENFSCSVNDILKICNIENSIIGLSHKESAIRRVFHLENRIPLNKSKTIITSGTIISKNVFTLLGEFREDFFIDSIDHEYCLRAHKHKINVLSTKAALINHHIGSKGGLIPIHNHERKFYIFRNVIVTIKLYWKDDIFWALKQFLRLITELFHAAFLEKDKIKKLNNMLRGIKNGLSYKT